MEVDKYQAANESCRQIVKDFVAGKTECGEFFGRMGLALAPFDPWDWAQKEMSPDQEKEAARYFAWTSDEEGQSKIPLIEDWKYGLSNEPYGWIDQAEYRSRLKVAFQDLLSEYS